TLSGTHYAAILAFKNSVTKSSYRTHTLNQQFVRENTETINCRCFHTKNNWAERNWLTSVTSRECEFGRREVTFGSNKHQDAAKRTLMFTRIVSEDLL